jgi:hypothetical protein
MYHKTHIHVKKKLGVGKLFLGLRKSPAISDYTPACRQAGIINDYKDMERIENKRNILNHSFDSVWSGEDETSNFFVDNGNVLYYIVFQKWRYSYRRRWLPAQSM